MDFFSAHSALSALYGVGVKPRIPRLRGGHLDACFTKRLTEIRQPDSTRAECHHAIVLRRDDKYIAQRHHVVMRMFSMSVDPH